jgi:hypothetical protein
MIAAVAEMLSVEVLYWEPASVDSREPVVYGARRADVIREGLCLHK